MEASRQQMCLPNARRTDEKEAGPSLIILATPKAPRSWRGPVDELTGPVQYFPVFGIATRNVKRVKRCIAKTGSGLLPMK